MSKPITIGIQSQEGQKRVQVVPTAKTEELYKNVQKGFELSSVQFSLFKRQNKTDLVENSRTKTVKAAGLNHGDRLFMVPKSQNLFQSSNSSSQQETISKVPSVVVEDDIDVELSKQDGSIPKSKDKVNCQHGANSQCVHCIPYDPFDEEYLREQKIKFMSFHSYIRKLSGGLSKGKFAPLKNISCKVEISSRCEHPPYPQGICSKCQPSAITLNRQPWRHVDSIMFENPQIVDRFLQFWRESGNQRGGWLYGRYELHPEVPLGMKAVVCAIYEPPQETSKDTLKLLPDPKEEVIEEIAANLGLRRVGWIFTDLIPLSGGKVKCYRGGETHFLSAQEIITAAHYQNTFPNKCKQTDEGMFGSKFTTVCVTGNKENEVHMEGYQVSNQCMALVKDEILVPTKDAPELGYVIESTDEKYVPDVFFMEMDKYKNEIKKVGRPLPVEYLLIDVPVSSPLQPLATFAILEGDRKHFAVGNRLLESSLQDFNSFAQYMSQFRSAEFLTAVSDLHVLIFMATLDIMPLRDFLGPLYEAIRTANVEAAREWSYLDHWSQMQALIQATTMN
eukprot:GFUD01043747.1.p1 GENE.GFUD01043747.1~~GFUD01043747.1.p1  ORF type:complete len:562 (+),score=130.40 GFUD01043747.1:53-1738(+)